MKIENKYYNKKAQVTIFIILALIIVVAVALIFVLVKPQDQTVTAPEEVNSFIQGCIENSLEEINEKLISENLYGNLTSNYIVYKSEKYKYLCKASQFYTPCVNQEPMIIEYIRKVIEDETTKDAERCFSELKKNLQEKDYTVKDSQMGLSIEFSGEKIISKIEKEIVISKREEVRTFNKFSASINSPLYELANTIRNIINYESGVCEFNIANWMVNYPNVKITRFVTSDQSKIYLVTDRKSDKELGFAIKSCVLPAGI